MDRTIKELTRGFSYKAAARREWIDDAEAKLDLIFPQDYKDFLAYSNGAEGRAGKSYLKLFSLDRILKVRDLYLNYAIQSKLILFGNDGATWSYAFDSKSKPAVIVGVDPIAMDIDPPKYYADTLAGFLQYLFKDK